MTGDRRSAAVILAAGSSRRLGTPKQLLPYGDTTLLGETVDMVRRCRFDQVVLALGNDAASVRDHVDLGGVDVVEVADGKSGCGSSLRSAVGAVDARADGLILFLGDQPGIAATTVERLMAQTGGDHRPPAAIVVTHYRDRIGHPFWLGRSTFAAVADLRGDKALWRLIASGQFDTATLEVDTPVPPDVDTWVDYIELLSAAQT